MAAYGAINDGVRVIAWVKDGRIRRNSQKGELVGYEDNFEVLNLDQQHVGYLGGEGEPLKAWWSEA